MSDFGRIITSIDWVTVGKWFGAIAAVVTFFANLEKIFSWIQKIWHRISQKSTKQPHIPKETLRFILRPNNAWWHMGSSNDKPAMQVVCDWYVTNITSGAIKVCGARVRKPAVHGQISVRHPQSETYGDYYILPKYTTDGRSDFWIQPPIKNVGESLTLDLEFMDQYGNVHRTQCFF